MSKLTKIDLVENVVEGLMNERVRLSAELISMDFNNMQYMDKRTSIEAQINMIDSNVSMYLSSILEPI